jgi:hypothetical protein
MAQDAPRDVGGRVMTPRHCVAQSIVRHNLDTIRAPYTRTPRAAWSCSPRTATARKPPARNPQRRNARNSSSTNRGRPWPSRAGVASARNPSSCSRTTAQMAEALGLRGVYSTTGTRPRVPRSCHCAAARIPGRAAIARSLARRYCALRTSSPVAEIRNEARRICGIGGQVRPNTRNDAAYIPTVVSNRGRRRSEESQPGSTSSGAAG